MSYGAITDVVPFVAHDVVEEYDGGAPSPATSNVIGFQLNDGTTINGWTAHVTVADVARIGLRKRLYATPLSKGSYRVYIIQSNGCYSVIADDQADIILFCADYGINNYSIEKDDTVVMSS